MNYMIESAIQDLRSPNTATRLQAAEYLRDHAHPAAVSALLDALSDNSIDVAYAAAEALTHVGADVEPLVEARFYDVRDDSTRYLALVVLAAVASVESEGLLIEVLHSGDPNLSEVAAEGLRRINTPNAHHALDQWGA